MKNKLIYLIGIVFLMTMISVRADTNVPIILSFNGTSMRIQADNLDFNLNLSTIYNISQTNTSNYSNYGSSQILMATLTGADSMTLDESLKELVIQCNRTWGLINPYINCSLTTQVLNQTQDALGICLLDKSTCTNSLNYWTTSATPFAITNPGEIKPKFDSAKNSLIWLVVVAALAAGFGVYYWTSKKGKGKRPSDLQTADYD